MARGNSQTADQIRSWEEYMLATQAALRLPPNEPTPYVDDLESRLRHLAQVERNLGSECPTKQ